MGAGIPSCQGFNRQNVEETGSFQIWGMVGLFFCCLKISYEMAGSYSDVVKCPLLGSPLFHHTDLMERLGVKRQRQTDKDRRSVYGLSWQGSSAAQSRLKLHKDTFYSSVADTPTWITSNPQAALQPTRTRSWYLNPSPQLLMMKYTCVLIGFDDLSIVAWSACSSTELMLNSSDSHTVGQFTKHK